MMRKAWVKVLLCTLVVLEMAMIYWFSAQTGEESSLLSGSITEFVVRLVVPGFEALAAEQQLKIMDVAHYLVRKGAHFTEYVILGATLLLALKSFDVRRSPIWAYCGGTFYAVTDEMHQLTTAARSGNLKDVCIDSAGVLTSIALVCLLMHWLEKRRNTKKA